MSLVAARSLRTPELPAALHSPRLAADGAIIIPYDIGAGGADVLVSLFDARGRRVDLLDQGWRNAGHHAATWNPRPDTGARAARGVYFVRLNAGTFVAHRRVLVLRD
jgi:hypothetical protein